VLVKDFVLQQMGDSTQYCFKIIQEVQILNASTTSKDFSLSSGSGMAPTDRAILVCELHGCNAGTTRIIQNHISSLQILLGFPNSLLIRLSLVVPLFQGVDALKQLILFYLSSKFFNAIILLRKR
jgi:hypothetical protein